MYNSDVLCNVPTDLTVFKIISVWLYSVLPTVSYVVILNILPDDLHSF